MRLKYFASILCALAFFADLRSFEWQNNGVPVRQGANIEWSRAGAGLDDGSMVYVWSDTQNGDRDVKAQRVSADGTALWDTPVIVDAKIDRQEDPVVIETTDNQVIVAWIDFSNQIAGDVYAQKINAEGELQWTEGGVPVCIADGKQISLNIVKDNAGGAYIIWLDYRNSGGSDIYGMHVGADGSLIWETDGIAIADNDGNQKNHTFWEDGEGGAVMAYVNNHNNNSDIYATRILSDGTKPWGNFIVVSGTEAMEEQVKMAHLSNNKFAVAWRERSENNPVGFINGRIINLDGTMTEANPICNAQGGQLDPRLTANNDGSYFVAWQDKRTSSPESDIFVQKCDNNGIAQWAENGVPAVQNQSVSQTGQRAVADGNGGCYVIWDDPRSGNTDLYIQHFNASGEILMEENGIPVCDESFSQEKGLIRKGGDNIFVIWSDLRNGSAGLYYQVFNNNLPQLDENGNLVFWGLSGNATKQTIFVNGTDTYIGWLDSRSAQEQVYCQKLNSAGENMFPENGIPVLPNNNKQKEYKMIKRTGGGAYFGIIQIIGGIEKAYAAAIDSDGNILWTSEGIELGPGGSGQETVVLAEYNEGILYGFTKLEGEFPIQNYKLYAQYIVNGEKQWGNEGQMIMDISFDAIVKDIVDDIFIVKDGNADIYAQRIDENGDVYEGWSQQGTVICNDQGIQSNPQGLKTDEGILIYWTDSRNGDFDIYAQLIRNDASVVWETNGVPLVNLEQDQTKQSISYQDGYFYTVWEDFRNGQDTDISFQKFNLENGSPEWENNGFFAVSRDSTQTNPSIACLGNNHVIAWEDYFTDDYSDIYIQSFNNEDGNIITSDPNGEIVCNARKKQAMPVVKNMNGDFAIVSWIDGRSSGKEEIKGIYAQKVNAYQVDNDDMPEIKSVSLSQNSPNPFRPNSRSNETKISFNLPEDGKAEIAVYNVKGQKIASVADDNFKAGSHTVKWNGQAENGKEVTSGIYFYKLSTEKKTIAQKMVILK
ncbi:MAG: hypothetical protein CSB55_02015 [Candidatus Cloacimonadota bacterium]|nr:MAG: hypothetical protein CSB55_02015 [Candidatus Cloacimonadota bacterium]